jgi:hypothetical protein
MEKEDTIITMWKNDLTYDETKQKQRKNIVIKPKKGGA